MLPAYKRALGEDASFFELLDTLFALVAIGRRTSRLRAEIAKALEAAPRWARTPPATRLRELMGAEVATVCGAAGQLLDADDQELEAWLNRTGSGLLDDDDRPATTNLPSDAIRTAVLSTYTDGLTDGRNVAFSLSLIAAAARGPAEQFYFERQLLDSARAHAGSDAQDREVLAGAGAGVHGAAGRKAGVRPPPWCVAGFSSGTDARTKVAPATNSPSMFAMIVSEIASSVMVNRWRCRPRRPR